jgi:hypothetical protein
MRLVLVLCLLLAACGTPPPPMPTGLVLRATVLAAMSPPLATAELPDFSLYGDGKVIRRSQAAGSLQTAAETAPNPRLAQQFYEYALDTDLNQDATYDNPNVLDGSVLILTLVAGGRHVVKAANPDASDDGRLKEIAHFHETLMRWPGEATPYHPTKLFAVGWRTESGPPTPWPFDPFEKGTCVVLDGAEPIARAANPATRWISGGVGYRVTFRPALPDENTCADIGQQ